MLNKWHETKIHLKDFFLPDFTLRHFNESMRVKANISKQKSIAAGVTVILSMSA